MIAPRTRALADRLADAVAARGGLRVMEVCGTHTVSLFRTGVRSLLPPGLKLISGPGCPVCVTTQGYLDTAADLALTPGVTVATYGDMVRVPGTRHSLAQARAAGGRVEVVYSARDAVRLARERRDQQVVFLAVGFETTAPATAVAVLDAEAEGLDNFTILPGHKLVVPAMEALLAAGDVPLDGFLCPGHVSVIIGAQAYRPIVARWGKACVVGGFEADGMLAALVRLAEMARDGAPGLDNAYRTVVAEDGQQEALALLDRVFVAAPAPWRALGTIPGSGLDLRPAYRRFDAHVRFGVDTSADHHPEGCRCGEVIQGRIEPPQCRLFRGRCTPANPIGPCMVSSEGTCAAWFKYARAGLPT